jgi:PAS domain S-box-containing protein
MAEGKPYSYEDYFPNLNKYFKFTTVPLGDHFITTGADITAIRQGAEVLKESEERFRILAETSPIGVGVSSADGVLQYANPSYERILGYDHMELVGKRASDLYCDPEERQSWLTKMRKNGVIQDIETRLKKKDGSPVWVLISASPIFYAGKQAVMGTIQDITDRKIAEETLAKTERKYRELIQFAPAGIYEIDFRTRKFTTVNKAMIEMTGYSKEELLAMDPLDILAKECHAIFQERVLSISEMRHIRNRRVWG